MPYNLDMYGYLLAAVLFVFALKAMSSHKTARRGNLIGALGMAIAIGITVYKAANQIPFWTAESGWLIFVIGAILGSLIGAYLALTVKMTGMPQMVAMFNGFGGLASAMVAMAVIWQQDPATMGSSELMYSVITVALSTLIGWVTFTGSMVAFAKLQEFLVSGRPVVFPMQKIANFAALAAAIALIVIWGYFPAQRWLIIPLAVLAAGLGVMYTIPIGGADMPVVISLLNSYSGLAACATGFVLGNYGLIIAGSLVGSSGIVLTRIMCKAMNRSLVNVLFGAVGAVVKGPGGGEERRVTSWTPEDAAICLENATHVAIIPGYGMAAAQAQHIVKELADVLEARGVDVAFGIHEVAGRMPGHMNVLLAEAEVPYEKLLDRETVNAEMDQTDAVIVLGANDVVNPVSRHDETSPIYGMPIIDVDKAGTCMVIKRSLNPGFAGVDNELFYMEHTAMVFGDGKQVVTGIVAALREE